MKCFINIDRFFFFFHIPHSGYQRFKVTLRPNSKSTWLSFPLEYKKVLFKARPAELIFTFCPNLSNGQSECEVCRSDVNVIPNLSIVPKKLVMVTLKLTELHSENQPILPCKQRFLSCMAFSVLAEEVVRVAFDSN